MNRLFASKPPKSNIANKKEQSTDALAREVIAGKWGNGEARKARLTEAGFDPTAVQENVNRLFASKP